MKKSKAFIEKYLPSYQDAGRVNKPELPPIDPSKLSREQYEALYNQGRVATYDPASGAYQPPMMEGITITADKPKSASDFFDRYNKKANTSADHLLEAMFTVPIDYVTGLPQAAMSYMLDPEKSLTPSEALDITNPVIALVTEQNNKRKHGGKISSIQKLGYKRNSPHKNRRSININSNLITMDGVDIPLMLVPDNDEPMVAPPNSGQYMFPNSSSVQEIPMGKYRLGGMPCMECGGTVKYQGGGKITYQTRRLINPEQIQSFDKDKLKAVQQDLKAKGLYTGKIDGIYGPLTDKAIKQYNAKLTETPVTASIPEITIKASKKVKSTPNDLVYTPDEMKEYMDVYKARIEECTAGDAQCLERANRYYNTYVAPLVGAKSSWQELEGGLPEGIGSSVDSWDIHGVLREKGGKKIPVPYQLEKQAFMVPPGMEKEYHPLKGQEDLIRSLNIPLGAIIGFGNKGGTSSKYGKGTILYNTKQGAVATEHSARVVGFTPDGIPMVYDYDRIVPLTEYKFINKGIYEITAPQGTENKTFAQLKDDRNFWKEPPVVNTKSIPLYKGEETHPQLGRKEFVNFQNALLKDKQKIAETLEIDNKKYDDLARVAQALAITETQGGDPIARKFGYTVDKVTEPLPLKTRKEIKIKAFDIDGAGVSQGLTQINEENLFTRPEVTRKLKAMGITQDNFDPYNPHHSAAATMTLANFFMERQEKDIKNNPHQLTPLQVLSYQWNRPGDLRKGTAEGKSIHSKKLANIYNQIPLPSEDEETVINTPVYSPTEVYGGYKAMTLPSSFNFQQGGTVQSFLNKWLNR